MSARQSATSTGAHNRATVAIGDGVAMPANVRVASPGVLSMSFRLGPDIQGTRLVGDLATVTLDRTGTQLLVEIGSTSVMGYVEVCEASIVQHIAGPPIQRRAERRKSTRYRFGEPANVRVAPIGTGQSAVGQLGDISAGGCGVELARLAYQKIGGLIEASLALDLPGLESPITLSAKRRNTRAMGDDVVWMGMVWSREPTEAAAIKELSEYLNTRAGRF